MWEDFLVVGFLCGRNDMLGIFRVVKILCGRNFVWEEFCVGGFPCGRNVCGEYLVW